MFPDSTSLVSPRHGTFRVKCGFNYMFHLLALTASPFRANLTANKRPVRQILALDPKLLSKKDLNSLGVLSGSDCLLGASLNGDRSNACGISEDTLLWAIRCSRPLARSAKTAAGQRQLFHPDRSASIYINECVQRVRPAGKNLSVLPPIEHRQTPEPARGQASTIDDVAARETRSALNRRRR